MERIKKEKIFEFENSISSVLEKMKCNQISEKSEKEVKNKRFLTDISLNEKKYVKKKFRKENLDCVGGTLNDKNEDDINSQNRIINNKNIESTSLTNDLNTKEGIDNKREECKMISKTLEQNTIINENIQYIIRNVPLEGINMDFKKRQKILNYDKINEKIENETALIELNQNLIKKSTLIKNAKNNETRNNLIKKILKSNDLSFNIKKEPDVITLKILFRMFTLFLKKKISMFNANEFRDRLHKKTITENSNFINKTNETYSEIINRHFKFLIEYRNSCKPLNHGKRNDRRSFYLEFDSPDQIIELIKGLKIKYDIPLIGIYKKKWENYFPTSFFE